MSLVATFCSAQVVGYAVLNVDELLGGLGALVNLGFVSLGMGIAIVWSAVRAKSGAAAMSLLAFPVVTFGWGRLALQVPGTIHGAQIVGPDGTEVGPYYSEIGLAGVGIIMGSMAAVMAMFWVLGDRRLGWRVRIPVVLAVVAAHVLVVLWLMGRPFA